MNPIIVQATKFGAVGAVNSGIGLAVIFGLMRITDYSPLICNAFGFLIGVLVSFSLNRNWTFGSSAPVSATLPKFLAITCLAYGLNVLALQMALFAALNPYVAQLIGVVIYAAAGFSGNRWIVFRT